MSHRQTGAEVAAECIKQLEASGLSRGEIARRIGKSRQTVWRLVSGEVREPGCFTVSRLQALAAKITLGPP